MSEPKKETVRIVLPPRREGQTLASTPRETAMINLPPKPVPAPSAGAPSAEAPSAPAAASVIPSAPGIPPSAPAMPAPPTGLQPPSAPAIPKPPSFPGSAPKAPGVPPSAPGAPRAVTSPPSAPGVPRAVTSPPSGLKVPTVGLKAPLSAGPTPAAVRPEAKKETAKIGSGIALKPQATVKLQPRPQPSQAASATFKARSAEIVPAANLTEEEEIPMNWSIATLVTAVIALALQLWIMSTP